jgi:ubiquinone biosynthesis protein
MIKAVNLTFRRIGRLVYISHVLAKHGLDQLLVSIRFFSAFRYISYFNPWNWFRPKSFNRGVALRQALEELGPIFVKFGQALSTRPDIVPADIMIELCKLQDSVQPFSGENVLAILEKTYGQSPYTLFQDFDSVPLASASIAQVHSARLLSGEDVVIKILRPNIHKLIDRDLDILKTMAKLIDQHWLASKRLKPKEIIAEFEWNLTEELDLQREAANGAQLKRNFQESPLLYIPHIYWDYVRENVLVMERIYGIRVSNIAELQRHAINLRLLAERGLNIFFTQVFRHGFFHADMHPGNIFVSPNHPEDPQYICVDFGIIGTIGDSDKRYLVENLYAFFNRDYRRIALLHVESGWVPSTTRIEAFESAIRTVCEPIFEKPLKDISFALLIFQLFQVGRRFQMEIQPQLILLQKTLFASEGLGRQLYPDLNIWAVGKPFIKQWLREQVGPKALLKNIRDNMPFMIEQLPYMPKLLNDVLSHLKDQKTVFVKVDESKEALTKAKTAGVRGLGLGIFGAMGVTAGLSYAGFFSPDELSLFALGAALMSGGIVLIRSCLR